MKSLTSSHPRPFNSTATNPHIHVTVHPPGSVETIYRNQLPSSIHQARGFFQNRFGERCIAFQSDFSPKAKERRSVLSNPPQNPAIPFLRPVKEEPKSPDSSPADFQELVCEQTYFSSSAESPDTSFSSRAELYSPDAQELPDVQISEEPGNESEPFPWPSTDNSFPLSIALHKMAVDTQLSLLVAEANTIAKFSKRSKNHFFRNLDIEGSRQRLQLIEQVLSETESQLEEINNRLDNYINNSPSKNYHFSDQDNALHPYDFHEKIAPSPMEDDELAHYTEICITLSADTTHGLKQCRELSLDLEKFSASHALISEDVTMTPAEEEPDADAFVDSVFEQN